MTYYNILNINYFPFSLHLSSSIDPGLNIKKLGGLYISFDGKKQKPSSSVIKQPMEKKKDQVMCLQLCSYL